VPACEILFIIFRVSGRENLLNVYGCPTVSRKFLTEPDMTIVPVLPPPRTPVSLPDYVTADARLRDAAQKLEATFLAEMLKSAGLGSSRSAFGGGIGEDQFSSFLREAQAQELAKSGGIGLAESLFHAMKLHVHA
jgi:peptidoglycan hydrolase FlgJ